MPQMLKRFFFNHDGTMKPWVTYGIVAVVVCAGGYLLYAAWTRGDRPLPSTLMCANAGCGFVQQRVIGPGEDCPQKCPKCSQTTLYIAFHCRKCGNPLIWNENRGLQPPTQCPKCGQENRHGS